MNFIPIASILRMPRFDFWLPAVVGEQFFFFANRTRTIYSDLFVSDGTASGTRQLEVDVDDVTDMQQAGGELLLLGKDPSDSRPSFASRPSKLWVLNSDLKFELDDTVQVANTMTIVGDQVVLQGSRRIFLAGETQTEIARTSSGDFAWLDSNDDAFYFRSGGQISYSNLRAAFPLDHPSLPESSQLAMGSGMAFFDAIRYERREGEIHQLMVHRLDAGNHRTVEHLADTPGPIRSMLIVGEKLFFVTSDQLWVSDGTIEGTHRVGDVIVESTYSSLHQGDDGKVLFSGAADGIDFDIWVSDGTEAGTLEVADLSRGTQGSTFIETGRRDPVLRPLSILHGEVVANTIDGLFRIDPSTNSATFMGKIFPVNVFGRVEDAMLSIARTPDGRMLLFVKSGLRGDLQRALWVENADGTLERIWSATGTDGHLRSGVQVWDQAGDGMIYFLLDRPHHPQLWRTDGTATGTELIAEPFSPRVLGATSHGLFYQASDPSDERQHGVFRVSKNVTDQLNEPMFTTPFWGPTITETKTHTLIVDGERIYSARRGDDEFRLIADLPNLASTLRLDDANEIAYFDVYEEASDSRRLWRTDGTDTGTFKLPSWNTQTDSELETNRVRFFVRERDRQHELVVSDGTAEGTRVVHQFSAFRRSNMETFTIAVGERIYFRDHRSLFFTDGESSTLVREFDIESRNEFGVGERLVFTISSDFGLTKTFGAPMERKRELCSSRMSWWTRCSRSEIEFFSRRRTPNQALNKAPNFGSPTERKQERKSSRMSSWSLNGLTETEFCSRRPMPNKAPNFGSPTERKQERKSSRMSLSNLSGPTRIRCCSSQRTPNMEPNCGQRTAPSLERVSRRTFTRDHKVRTQSNFLVTNDGLLFTATDDLHGREVWRFVPDANESPKMDFDGSGTTDFADFLVLSSNFGQTDKVFADGDANDDGTVDFSDFLLFASVFDDIA